MKKTSIPTSTKVLRALPLLVSAGVLGLAVACGPKNNGRTNVKIMPKAGAGGVVGEEGTISKMMTDSFGDLKSADARNIDLAKRVSGASATVTPIVPQISEKRFNVGVDILVLDETGTGHVMSVRQELGWNTSKVNVSEVAASKVAASRMGQAERAQAQKANAQVSRASRKVMAAADNVLAETKAKFKIVANCMDSECNQLGVLLREASTDSAGAPISRITAFFFQATQATKAVANDPDSIFKAEAQPESLTKKMTLRWSTPREANQPQSGVKTDFETAHSQHVQKGLPLLDGGAVPDPNAPSTGTNGAPGLPGQTIDQPAMPPAATNDNLPQAQPGVTDQNLIQEGEGLNAAADVTVGAGEAGKLGVEWQEIDPSTNQPIGAPANK